MIKKERRFKHGQFVEYFIAQPDNSSYWGDADKFCKYVLCGCEVCWTCARFDMITYLEESRCTCGHYYDYIDKPWKQKCKEFHPKTT